MLPKLMGIDGNHFKTCSVIKSRCDEFPEGTQVIGYFGWRDVTVYKPVPNGIRTFQTIQKMPELKGLPDSYALGCLGMPG